MDADFIGPPVKKMKTRSMKRKVEPTIQETDEEATTMFVWENPEYVQYERRFCWKHNLEKKKTELGARPST